MAPAPVDPRPRLEAAQAALETAEAELETAEANAAAVKAAILAGDGTATPHDLDDAETRARHAALSLEAARAAHDRAHEQARRDAWPAVRDERMAAIADDPAGELRARLEAVSPRVRAALAELRASIAEATAPAEAHNEAVLALATYLTAGGYSDPADHAMAFGGDTVSCAGRGGARIDARAIVDVWLRDALDLDPFTIPEWLERVRRADYLAGRPNPTR